MKKQLIVLVPNHKGNPGEFAPLKKMLIETTELADSFWLEFNYIEPLWSNKDPEFIANDLSYTIENFLLSHRDQVSSIILVGHSMGTILLRRAFLNASGYGTSGHLSHPWAGLVKRIILMGGIGRGVVLSQQRLINKIFLYPAVAISRLLGIGKMRWAIFSGADFISRLRIDWIVFNTNNNSKKQPTIVHLLGNDDTVINPHNVIEIEQFSNVITIGVPKTNHFNVIIPDENTRTPLLHAFSGEASSNRSIKIPESAKRVFFLLHGIRDSRSCLQNVAKALKEKEPDAKIIVPTYGYLSARRFLSSQARNSYVPWFIDQYAEYLARNPAAEFFFAGHSNGTYILGEALKRIPRMTFTRVYLAASVLPENYGWNPIIEQYNQVKVVRSDMGAEDWPVGVLCHSLNRLGIDSIGTGGFSGFLYGDSDHIAYNQFAGGHSSMLTGENATSIASFLLSGEPAEVENVNTNEIAPLFTFFHKYGDVVLPLLLFVIFSGIIFLASLPVFFPTLSYVNLGPVSSLIIFFVLWTIFGRF